MPDDGLLALAGRRGWVVSGGVAVYEPEPDGWGAVLRPRTQLGRIQQRYDVVIVDSRGRPVLAMEANTVAQARRLAEDNVPAKTEPNPD